jgi:predicted O-methyltransferase YrrM
MAMLQGEDDALREARKRGDGVGVPAIPAEVGALLRFLVRSSGARQVVEVGSGAGYSGLWLLAGLGGRGTLTTIELDPERQALAQRAYGQAGMGDRVRSMLGAALTVLPRLADTNYDVVFLDAVKAEYLAYLEHARRLLRPGGLLIADNVLWHGRVDDPAVTDPDTEGLRAFARAIADAPDLISVLLPIGDGVLVATTTTPESR